MTHHPVLKPEWRLYSATRVQERGCSRRWATRISRGSNPQVSRREGKEMEPVPVTVITGFLVRLDRELKTVLWPPAPPSSTRHGQ